MKETFWTYFKRYAALAVSVLITILAISSVNRDIDGTALNLAKRNLEEDAQTFTSYIDSTIEGKLDQLWQLAKTVKATMDSEEETMQALQDYKSMFNSVTVLATTGEREVGDHITLQLSGADILDELINQKKAVVYSDSIREVSSKEVIVLAVPVEVNDRVTGIVVGTVAVATLNNIMDKWGYSQDGCAFIMTTEGRYVTRGDKFEKVLSGKANNYLTYLGNCITEGEYTAVSDIERAITDKKQIPLDYTYNGNGYIGRLCPSRYESWYIGYVEGVESFRSFNASVGNSTKVLLAMAVILWVFWIAVLVKLIYKSMGLSEELERHNMLNRMEKSLVFEFQFEPKRLQFFGDTMRMFGKEAKVMFGEEVYEVYQYVHEDDRSLRSRIHQFYDDDNPKFMSEVRIENGEDGYRWYRITGMLVKDMKFGTNQKFVGRIEDASQQIIEEKNLVQRAENDLLTGVFNKKTMEGKVSECLANLSGNNHCIFYIIDLDNFKNVNDKLGHMYGDTAIVDTAKLLSAIFTRNAFVGRLGGDEFVACVTYDAFDEESLLNFVRKKADAVCEANLRTYANGNISVSISSSVGIAIAPEHGTDFETIYKRADSALYRSKNAGKNCYHIYQKD